MLMHMYIVSIRLSSSTGQSSSFQLMKRHKRRRRRHKVTKIDRVRLACVYMAHNILFLCDFFVPCVTPSLFLSQSSSFSSITDSTMSLNIITVTLNMGKISIPKKCTSSPTLHHNLHFPLLFFSLLCTEKYNFLGISIVGQSNDRGDGGIYIGSIMKGGAVAADGRIEPGDMLLQVG